MGGEEEGISFVCVANLVSIYLAVYTFFLVMVRE